ncbi:MAG: hypothetical protein ABS58_04390 [Mesorhizobium sp. SCN 65-20]|nr:MAG: hypothetical protein ABS58_04390 [Mesorhizobium sp. SCN 65-20]
MAAWLVGAAHAMDWPQYSNGSYASYQDEARGAQRGINVGHSGGHMESFLFRLIEWYANVSADMDVYFQTCQRPKLPPP